MDATEGKGMGSTLHMVTVDVCGSAIGADPRKLGEEMARIVDAPLRNARESAWIDMHDWEDAWPRA